MSETLQDMETGSDPDNALLRALVGTLKDALAPVRVYASVPADAVMPYVVIDAVQSNDASGISHARDETFVYLSVWTRYPGPRRAYAIVGQMYRTLHRTRLPLESGTMIAMSVVRRGSAPDIAEDIYKGTMTVRCLVQHT